MSWTACHGNMGKSAACLEYAGALLLQLNLAAWVDSADALLMQWNPVILSRNGLLEACLFCNKLALGFAAAVEQHLCSHFCSSFGTTIQVFQMSERVLLSKTGVKAGQGPTGSTATGRLHWLLPYPSIDGGQQFRAAPLLKASVVIAQRCQLFLSVVLLSFGCTALHVQITCNTTCLFYQTKTPGPTQDRINSDQIGIKMAT